jgi:RNA polymerase-binding transcription factor DksA
VRELADVEAALARLAQGVYGACSDCGADIEPARLRAYVTATRCHECQARHENQRRDTSPSL